MNAYSEDLRKKIVEAVERGMPKIQAAKTFGVGTSSVKRYASKLERGESLAPNKSPGSGAVTDPARRRGSPSGSAGRRRRRLLLSLFNSGADLSVGPVVSSSTEPPLREAVSSTGAPSPEALSWTVG